MPGHIHIFAHEGDHLAQGVVVGKDQILPAGDPVMGAGGSEELRLLDRIHSQVGFEVEIQIQHFHRVACFFAH